MIIYRMFDPEGRLDRIKIVQKMRQDHQMTVISITHDLDEVAMSYRIKKIKKGEFNLIFIYIIFSAILLYYVLKYGIRNSFTELKANKDNLIY